MKTFSVIYILQLAAICAAAQAQGSNDKQVGYDTKVTSKIDTKAIDIDLKKDDYVDSNLDTKYAQYSEKEHPKGRDGSITEIKPAKDIKSKEGSLAEEDVPLYMKENEGTGVSKETKTINKKIDGVPVKIETTKDDKSSSSSNSEEGQFHSFLLSASMIIVSEIGDKTFLIAALMAMRSPRLVVFSAAASALVIMTILSGIVGHALPSLIPQRLTQFLASALFVIFGYKLLREGMEMSNEIGVNDEVAEVEEEIALSSINDKNNDIESGDIRGDGLEKKGGIMHEYLKQLKQLLSFVLSPTWVQVFVLTFLGEWGDRSQIATIALAAGSDYWFVILGGCVGHTLCTAVAVLGGMFLASKISMKQVTLGGAATFFIFAVLYLIEAVYGEHSS